MSWPELSEAGRVVLQMAWREYRSVYGNRVLLLSTAPRYLLQAGFFSTLGYVYAGPGGLTYAFIGSCCHVASVAAVVKVVDVLTIEKEYGTAYRLRLGRPSMAAVAAIRSLLYLVEGVVAVVLVTALVGLALGQPVATELIARTPMIVLVVASMLGLGFAGAALATGRRADLLVGNLLAYVLLLTSGAVVPLEPGSPVSGIAGYLPLTHGLAAIRGSIDGATPWTELGLEVVVGGMWWLSGLAILRLQQRRSLVEGLDDYA